MGKSSRLKRRAGEGNRRVSIERCEWVDDDTTEGRAAGLAYLVDKVTGTVLMSLSIEEVSPEVILAGKQRLDHFFAVPDRVRANLMM